MTQQDLVATICQQTGISKKDLAQWIGTDPSVLCRYIMGTRSLPLRAMQQLLFLHQQLADLPPLPPATAALDEMETDWQQQADNCRQQLSNLQSRYKTMNENERATAKALQLLAVLAADTVMLNPQKERWIEEQRYQAEKLAAESNKAAQKKVQVQILLMTKQLEVYMMLAQSALQPEAAGSR